MDILGRILDKLSRRQARPTDGQTDRRTDRWTDAGNDNTPSAISLRNKKTYWWSRHTQAICCNYVDIMWGSPHNYWSKGSQGKWIMDKLSLRLIQMVLLCTSPYCKRSTASLMQIHTIIFISQYLQAFRNINSRVAKMHVSIHFPKQMLLYGPLRHTWCMRF